MTSIKEAVAHLEQGGMVAYPTETFYGLGVDAENKKALEQLVELKGRESTKPFPLLIPNLAKLDSYVTSVPKMGRELAKRYWPGPLTLIFSMTHFGPPVRNENGGVGLRISAHPVASQLTRQFGRCLTATSANRAGHPPATSASQLQKELNLKSLLILDGGDTPGGSPSTVVDVTEKKPKLIREGAIAWEEIQKTWRK